jgi:hypothetical protein
VLNYETIPETASNVTDSDYSAQVQAFQTTPNCQAVNPQCPASIAVTRPVANLLRSTLANHLLNSSESCNIIMASTSSDTQPQPITLHFQNLVRVAGETIEGCVDLHVPLLRKDGIENLRIEMQGVIKTYVYSMYSMEPQTDVWACRQILRTYGQVTVMHKQVVPVGPSQLCSTMRV